MNQTNLSLKTGNLTFKRGLIVLKPAKNSAVIHLPLDSVLDDETWTLNGTAGSESRDF